MSAELSVIIAINNEEENIKALYDRLSFTLAGINKRYEIIFVEDGSNDNSYQELCGIFHHDPRVKVIKLRKNFGQTIGLLVGMNFARSEIIVTMDGDLQHDPRDILRLLEKMNFGYDLVNGKKIKRTDSLFEKIWPSLVVKRLVCMAFGLQYADINSSFRAYRHRIVDKIKGQGEALRFLPLMTKAEKIRFCEVDIVCNKRGSGKSHFDFIGRTKRLAKDILLLLTIKREGRVVGNINLNHLISELRFH